MTRQIKQDNQNMTVSRTAGTGELRRRVLGQDSQDRKLERTVGTGQLWQDSYRYDRMIRI